MDSLQSKESSSNRYGIEARSTYEQKEIIEKNRERVPKDIVDILKEKSCIVGVNDNSEKLKFSSHIRKAYTDILDAFNGRTKVIMEIVASVPDVKIIYLPNEDNIHKYEQKDEEPEFILGGITYAKSERIIIAAKGYDQEKSYRKFLGVIIHEFCHFAVHETFGNWFKPYYADDEVAVEKWNELVEQYKSSDLDELPVIREIFDYDESKWVDELVVRYPQIFVEHHGSEFLHKFEDHFMDLHSIYIKNVHREFESEKVKTASLRSVNKNSLLGDENSKLFVNSLETEKKMNFDAERQIVKTNQTYLVMKNIFNHFQKDYNFKSKFMFIELKFLEDDENIKLIEKALQCSKKTRLIINGHDYDYDDAYVRTKIQENLTKLLNNSYVGCICLISDQTQNLIINAEVFEHDPIIFEASDLSGTFKNSLKVNFQGSELSFDNLIELNLFEDFFESIINGCFTNKTISVGNQLKITHDKYLEGTYAYYENSGSMARINLNDDACLVELFKKNPHIIIHWIPYQKNSESMKMCMRLKSIYSDHWIVYIDFSRSDYPFFDLPYNESEYLKYFSGDFLKHDLTENEFFYHFIDIGKVIFIFEGIDKNSRYSFHNIKKILKFLTKLKKMSKICLFTQPDEFELLKELLKDENFEEIRLTGFEKLRSSCNKKISHNDVILKASTHYFDISFKEFSRKMFDLGNKGIYNDIEILQNKINLINQAELYFKSKKYEKSIEKIKAVFKIESNSELALSQDIRSMKLWGNVLCEQKMYSEAKKKYDEAKKLAIYERNDSEKNFFINEAVFHYISKENDQSIKMINEALKIASNSCFSKSQNARACYIWGFTLQEKKEYEEAIKQFENGYMNCEKFNIKNQRKFSLINQASSYFSMRQYKKAIGLIRKSSVIELDFETDRILNIYATSLWANALFYLKDYSTALQKFEIALNMCTDGIYERKFFLIDVANCHYRLKNYEIAIVLIKKALKIKSNTDTVIESNAFSMNLWGLILYDKKNYSAATEKFENALNMCTNEMIDERKKFLTDVANGHYQLRNYDKTIKFIETALKIRSDTKIAIELYASSMNLWGHVLLDQKSYSAAIEKFENALNNCTDEMIDNKKRYLNDAADCHHRLKNYEKAIELIKKALQIKSDTEAAIKSNSFSMNLWGLILYHQKNFLEAIEKYENAISMCTNEMNDEKKINLNYGAYCYHKLKNNDRAIELIEAALNIASDSEIANVQNASSMQLWGCILYDKENYSASIEKLKNALNMCTDKMNDFKKIYINNLADCYHKL